MAKGYARFTLFNFLVAMAIIAMGLALWLVGRHADSLRKQTDPLKQLIGELEYELGHPDVADPSRMHLKCKSRMSGSSRYFQYRVYVPEDCQGKIELAINGDAGLKRKGGHNLSFAIPSGKHTIEFDFARSVTGDDWEYNLFSRNNGGYSFSGPMPPYFEEDGTDLGIRNYVPPPEGLEAGDSFHLLRKKTKRKDGSTIELVLEISLTGPTGEKGLPTRSEEASDAR